MNNKYDPILEAKYRGAEDEVLRLKKERDSLLASLKVLTQERDIEIKRAREAEAKNAELEKKDKELWERFTTVVKKKDELEKKLIVANTAKDAMTETTRYWREREVKKPEGPKRLAEILQETYASMVFPDYSCKKLAQAAADFFESVVDGMPNCDCGNVRCQEGCLNKYNLKAEIRKSL